MKGRYKIKIVKSDLESNWYHEQIGATFYVEECRFDDLFGVSLAGLHYILKDDCEILERPEPIKIPFDWEIFKKGNHKVVTRLGIEVEQVYLFDKSNEKYTLYACIGSTVYCFRDNGNYLIANIEHDRDLFLVEK